MYILNEADVESELKNAVYGICIGKFHLVYCYERYSDIVNINWYNGFHFKHYWSWNIGNEKLIMVISDGIRVYAICSRCIVDITHPNWSAVICNIEETNESDVSKPLINRIGQSVVVIQPQLCSWIQLTNGKVKRGKFHPDIYCFFAMRWDDKSTEDVLAQQLHNGIIVNMLTGQLVEGINADHGTRILHLFNGKLMLFEGSDRYVRLRNLITNDVDTILYQWGNVNLLDNHYIIYLDIMSNLRSIDVRTMKERILSQTAIQTILMPKDIFIIEDDKIVSFPEGKTYIHTRSKPMIIELPDPNTSTLFATIPQRLSDITITTSIT